MALSVYSQISLIGFAALGLVYCALGYKYARFLLPISGVLVLEVLLYLFVSDTLPNDELFTALFYGGSAIVIYVLLFFVLRLSGLVIGILGSAVFITYVVFAFGLFAMPFVIPIFITLCLLAGLLGAVYQRVGVIVAVSLLGGAVAAGVVGFIIFAGGAETAANEPMINVLIEIIRGNAFVFLGASTALAAIGTFVQLKYTGFDQVLNNRTPIRYQKRKSKRKLLKEEGK